MFTVKIAEALVPRGKHKLICKESIKCLYRGLARPRLDTILIRIEIPLFELIVFQGLELKWQQWQPGVLHSALGQSFGLHNQFKGTENLRLGNKKRY